MDESLASLTEKQVINVCDGKNLGYIVDFKADIYSGRLTAIIVPSECGFFGLKKGKDIVIPWERICRIGKDAIIVDIGIIPCGDNCKKPKI